MAWLCGVMAAVGVWILVYAHHSSLDRIADALKRIADALEDEDEDEGEEVK